MGTFVERRLRRSRVQVRRASTSARLRPAPSFGEAAQETLLTAPR
jgi:hypothetical protein